MSSNKRFQILALAGGGYRGLYSAYLLKKMEEVAGCGVGHCFDLIAGTSIGGVVALGLANQIPAKTIHKSFLDNGQKIFSDKPSGRWSTYSGLISSALKSKYKQDQLKELLKEILGEDTLLSHVKHRVVIPSINITKGQVKVFKTSHHKNFKIDLGYKLVDIALATSAAPTIFPMAQIGESRYVDGGLYANSPDSVALHEAEHFLEESIENIHILSIGAIASNFALSQSVNRNMGILNWAADQRLLSTIISSQQQYTDFVMQHRMGDRYLRVDGSPSAKQFQDIGIDIASDTATKTLNGLAENSWEEIVGNAKLKNFLDHRAPTPKFFNLTD